MKHSLMHFSSILQNKNAITIFLATLYAFLFSTALFAQPIVFSPEIEKDQQPIIPQGESSEISLEVFNHGDAELIIKKVTVGCNCLEILSSPTKVAPKGSEKIKVKIISSILGSGMHSKMISLTCNDPRPSKRFFAIHFSFTVKPLFDLPRPFQFSIEPEKAFEKTLSLKALNGRKIKISKVESNSKFIEHELVQSETSPQLIMRLPPQTKSMQEQSRFKIFFNENGKERSVELLAAIRVLDRIIIEPKKFVNFSKKMISEWRKSNETGEAKSLEQKLIVRSLVKDFKFQLSDLKWENASQADLFQASIREVEKGSKYEITVKISPDAKPKSMSSRAKLVIQTSDRAKPTLQVRVFALFPTSR